MNVAAHPTRTTHVPATRFALSLPRTLRGEWIKLTTLRSTWWSIGITAVLTIGIAVLIASRSRPGRPGIKASSLSSRRSSSPPCSPGSSARSR